MRQRLSACYLRACPHLPAPACSPACHSMTLDTPHAPAFVPRPVLPRCCSTACRPLPALLVFPRLEIAFLESSMVAVAQSMGMLLAGASILPPTFAGLLVLLPQQPAGIESLDPDQCWHPFLPVCAVGSLSSSAVTLLLGAAAAAYAACFLLVAAAAARRILWHLAGDDAVCWGRQQGGQSPSRSAGRVPRGAHQQ